MKIRTTGRWWYGFLLGGFLVAALLLIREPEEEIRTVTFSDGASVQLVGVTYGTNHLTASTPLGRLICRLPKALRDSLLSHISNRRLGVLQRVTSIPTLMLWLGTSGSSTQGPAYRRVFLQSAGGSYAGPVQFLTLLPPTVLGLGPQTIDFTAIPHRSQYLELVLFGPVQEDPDEKRVLRFLNPGFSSVPPSP